MLSGVSPSVARDPELSLHGAHMNLAVGDVLVSVNDTPVQDLPTAVREGQSKHCVLFFRTSHFRVLMRCESAMGYRR